MMQKAALFASFPYYLLQLVLHPAAISQHQEEYAFNTCVAFCRNGRIGLFTFPFLSYFAKPIFTFYYFADLFVIESF